MAISFVQAGDSGTGDTGSGSATTCLSSNSTIGNTVVYLINLFSGDSVSSITSPMGSVSFVNAEDAGGGLYIVYCICLAVTGAGRQVTVTTTLGNGYYVQASEWSGVGGAAWAGGNTGTNTSPLLTVSCSPGDALLVAETGVAGITSYPGSPWNTYIGNRSYVSGGQNSLAYQIASGSSETANWTIS